MTTFGIPSPSVDDFDVHVFPELAEHLVDYWALAQMREHPQRTIPRQKLRTYGGESDAAPLTLERR